MTTYINEPVLSSEGVQKTMGKVLIATLYSLDPVLVGANKLGPDRLVLLVDKEPSKEQEKSLEVIKSSLP